MDGLRVRRIRWKPNATEADMDAANCEIRRAGGYSIEVYPREDDTAGVWYVVFGGPWSYVDLLRPWRTELTQ